MRLVPEMIYSETIAGPWGPTTGSPFGARLCWQITEATLSGPRITAHLVMPGADWIRLGPDGIRRQDQRLTFATEDGAVVLLRYDSGVVQETGAFLDALGSGAETDFADQRMHMLAEFDTGDPRYGWLTAGLFLGEGRLAGPRRIEYRIHRVE